jgi:hypothetical protein
LIGESKALITSKSMKLPLATQFSTYKNNPRRPLGIFLQATHVDPALFENLEESNANRISAQTSDKGCRRAEPCQPTSNIRGGTT